MTLARLSAAAHAHHLAVLGTCQTEESDEVGDGTLALLGPAEPGFWAHVTAEPEFADGNPDPLDRWSQRVITEIAQSTSGRALFPFGKPPRPFISWALRTGQCFVSPVALLVHRNAGLFVSFRGAIVLPEQPPPKLSAPSPCDICTDKPCLTACPVSALSSDGYDLLSCHDHLDTAPGSDCMTKGCSARRACPVGRNFHRVHQQSAYHMEQFHP